MRKFKESYKKYRAYTELNKKGEVCHANPFICMLDALDDCFTGNKLYDLYYKFIWCPIWRLFKKYPKDFIYFLKRRSQRSKYGISKQDAWAVNEYMMQVLYYGLRFFLQDEYGDEPIDWTARSCEIHNEELYNDAKNYIKSYEQRQESTIDNFYELDLQCTTLFKTFIIKHIDKIWT